MIYTDRTVTISDTISNIDKKIFLYRGDKEVEVRFTILNSEYKYKSTLGANVIERTDASWAQLVIKKPNTDTVLLSDICETSDGKVVLNITGEMIDEISELGEYTFQIRLYDESRYSRITIPEVIGGIVVKEPIQA